jgi:simple sugar transport system permease protein
MAATKHEKREPLLRLAKRDDVGPGKRWTIRIVSILVALVLGGIIFLTLGYSPISVYSYMINGSLGSALAFQQTVKLAIPLLGASLAIAPAFRMKFWNIGVEGQITMGGIFATYFALTFQSIWPSWLLLTVMFLAGAVGGAIWGLIPAVFRAKWGTNETLFTLMMNYIAIGIVKYLQGGPWEKKPRGTQQIGLFQNAARMPTVWNITAGLFIVILLVFFMFCYLKYTKHGYEIAVVGESEPTARYAGIDVGKVIVRTMVVSGAISGIVGFILVSGIKYTLSDSVAGGVGFTGITVAWLAQLNAFGMVIISLFLAVLEKGASTLNTVTNNAIPESMSDMLTGLILFCMLGSEFFIRFRLIFRGNNRVRKEGK